MIGTDARSRARVRSLERVSNELVARGQLWLWNRTEAFPAKESSPSIDAADRIFRYVDEILRVLEAEIGDNPFLAGDTPTVADFTAFPMFQTARERFDLPFGEDHPRLESWYKRFRSRPSADF